MRCPECVDREWMSTVQIEELPLSNRKVERFYDEEGLAHLHDPNPRGERYRCSNGHTWTLRWFVDCPSSDYPEEATL